MRETWGFSITVVQSGKATISRQVEVQYSDRLWIERIPMNSQWGYWGGSEGTVYLFHRMHNGILETCWRKAKITVKNNKRTSVIFDGPGYADVSCMQITFSNDQFKPLVL